MPRIELAQLLRPTTTPEQELLLEHFYTQFDNRSAANRQIVNVEPLFYQGAIAGSEFLIYAPTKLYICYSFLIEGNDLKLTQSRLTFYDESNNTNFRFQNQTMAYSVADADLVYIGNTKNIYNIYFSRITIVNYLYLVFIGYRVTLV